MTTSTESAGSIAFVLVCVCVPLLLVGVIAIFHAVRTRRTWRAGASERMSEVSKLPGVLGTYHALWGFDMIRAIRKIADLRGESPRPKMSPHFVVVLTATGLWLLHGARAEQGRTAISPEEFRSIKTAASGPSAFTTWFIQCMVEGQPILLAIRLSDPSSDFLNADYKWASAQAAIIDATMTR